MKLAADAMGTNTNTFHQWVSLNNKSAHGNIQKFHGLVCGLQWKDVRKNF